MNNIIISIFSFMLVHLHFSRRVVGFKKIKFYTNENVGSGELDLPERQMHTTSYWLTLPREVMTALPFASDDRRDGVVGLSYAMRQIAQLLLMCDARDIGVSIGPAREATEDGQAQAAAGPAPPPNPPAHHRPLPGRRRHVRDPPPAPPSARRPSPRRRHRTRRRLNRPRRPRA